jgi:hypothetical protein
MKRPLIINQLKLEEYTKFAEGKLDGMLDDWYELIVLSLKSKQCNEPYELNLSRILGVVNLEKKHGFDAVDDFECPTEVYEYKPSCNKKSPGGTINDDSIAKIEKSEQLTDESISGWLVLAGIDKEKFRYDCIYKFPLHIYSEDRRNYLAALMEKNKNQAKQTRSTYALSVKKSIELCEQLQEDYYVWERDK